MTQKTKLTGEEIKHLAALAKLNLTDTEIETYRNQLGETIEYIKNLDELDTTGVEPTNSVVNLKNVTYEDGKKSTTSLSLTEALQNAKKTKDNEFVVDRIM